MKNNNEDPIKNLTTPTPAQRVVIDAVSNGWRVGVVDSQSDFMGAAGTDYVFNDPDELARNVRQLIAPGEAFVVTPDRAELMHERDEFAEAWWRTRRDYAALSIERDTLLDANHKLLAEVQALKFPPAPVSLFGPGGNPLDGFRPGDLWTGANCETRCIVSVENGHANYWHCHEDDMEGYASSIPTRGDKVGSYNRWVERVGKDATRTRANFQPALHPGEPPQGFRVGDVWVSANGTTRRIFEVSPEAILYKNVCPNGTEMDDRLRRPRASAEWPFRVGKGAKLIRK